MPTLHELEHQALALSERDRADLAARLLSSLPSPPLLDDTDDGVSEALRREATLSQDPADALTEEQFEQEMKAWRNR